MDSAVYGARRLCYHAAVPKNRGKRDSKSAKPREAATAPRPLQNIFITAFAYLFFIALLIVSPLFLGSIAGSAMVESIGFVVLPAVCAIVMLLFWKPLDEVIKVYFQRYIERPAILGFALLFIVSESKYVYPNDIELVKLFGVLFLALASFVLLTYIDMRAMARVIALSGLLPSLYGFFLLLGRTSGDYSGMTGTFGLHNPFAGFLLMTIPLAIYALYESRDTRFLRLGWAFVVLVEIAAFIMTKSRAAHSIALVVLVIAAMLVMPRFRANIRGMRGVAWTLVAASFTLVTVVPYILYNYFQPAFRELDFSLKGRLIFWESGVRIFFDNPLFGTGPGTFANTYMRYQPNYIYYSNDPHSFIVSVMSGMGGIGILFIVAFIVYLIRIATRVLTLDNDRLSRAASLAILGANIWMYTVIIASVFCHDMKLMRNDVLHIEGAAKDLPYIDDHKVRQKWEMNRDIWICFALALCIFVLINNLPILNYEARAGSQSHVSQGALNSRIPYVPFYVRRLNEITSSGMSKGDRELALADLRDKLNEHRGELRKVAGFYYLRALIGNYSAPYAAEIDITKAISLDPHNHPEYYFSLVEWYRKNGRQSMAYFTLRSFLLDAIPVSEPIMPNHYRPTWMPMNREFGKMWSYLADYEREYGDPILADKYAATSRKFIEYADANGL
jgi:O-antigen ligase